MANASACCGSRLNILKKPENIQAKYTYLWIDLGAVLVPFLFSFYRSTSFYKTWKAFFTANTIVACVFILWDMLFTKMGIWGFNTRYLCGIFIYNLPLEEVLFFLCIPYASVFTYYCLKRFIKELRFPSRSFSVVLIVLLLLMGTILVSGLYTAVTFLSLGIFLIFLASLSKPTWLSHFYLSFGIILVPFFIVNGLLTGSWLKEPIVWYNDHENMGIRLFTIPLEDVFYGMLMLLLNTWLYERFRQTNPS